MPTASKIYQYLDHSSTPSRYLYIRAKSYTAAALVLGKPLARIKEKLRIANGELALQYAHLPENHLAQAIRTEMPKGLRITDFERIAALGYIKSAILSLHQCDINNSDLKQRLHHLTNELTELKVDISDAIQDRYTGL